MYIVLGINGQLSHGRIRHARPSPLTHRGMLVGTVYHARLWADRQDRHTWTDLMNRWMDRLMNRWMDRFDEQMDGQVDEQMDGQINEQMDGQID